MVYVCYVYMIYSSSGGVVGDADGGALAVPVLWLPPPVECTDDIRAPLDDDPPLTSGVAVTVAIVADVTTVVDGAGMGDGNGGGGGGNGIPIPIPIDACR